MGLIDSDAVREKLHEAGGCGAERNSWADGWDKAIDEAIRIIEDAPTVDAVPVVHGRWIDAHGIRNSKCENCGVEFCRVMEDCNYCPTCGAKMDGNQECNS